MGGVLSSVASDGLELAVVSAERDVESNNGLAGLNQVKIFWVDASLESSRVVEEFDLFEETGLAVHIEAWADGLWHGGGGRERSRD